MYSLPSLYWLAIWPEQMGASDTAILVILFVIILIRVLQYRRKSKDKTPKATNSDNIACCNEDADSIIVSMFPLLLVAPCICATSHLGYIILAWITEPSRSTTTLILYYFLFFYLFLIFRKSYKLGTKFLKKKTTKSDEKYNLNTKIDSSPGNNDSTLSLMVLVLLLILLSLQKILLMC